MGKRRRRRLGEAGWRTLLGRFASSGLGVGAFCRGEGVSAASFYRWRHLLGETGTLDSQVSVRPASGRGARVADVHSMAADESTAFVDLGALTAAARGGRLELRIELGDGVVLHLARG